MTAGQRSHGLSTVSLQPVVLAAVLAATLLAGGVLGGAMTLQLGSTDDTAAAAVAPPAPPFGSVRFRAEEHGDVATPPSSGRNLDQLRNRLGGP